MTIAKATDPVKAPKHYCYKKDGFEQIDVSRFLPGLLTQAFKYVWRAGFKDNAIEDILKSIQYLDYEIENMRTMQAKINPYYSSLLYKRLLKVDIRKAVEGMPDNKQKVILCFFACGVSSLDCVTSTEYINKALNPLKELLVGLVEEIKAG